MNIQIEWAKALENRSDHKSMHSFFFPTKNDATNLDGKFSWERGGEGEWKKENSSTLPICTFDIIKTYLSAENDRIMFNNE